MEFESGTGKVITEDSKYPNYNTYACVKFAAFNVDPLHWINLKEKKPELDYNKICNHGSEPVAKLVVIFKYNSKACEVRN